jgi:hypothetical protein
VLLNSYHKKNQQYLKHKRNDFGTILKIIKASILEYLLVLIYLLFIGQNYETEPPNYYSEEYYEDHAANKRRGFAVSICRFYINKY